MSSKLPDFSIPIEDEHAAQWWWDEWTDRFRQTNDHAFKEAAEAMSHYIDRHLDKGDT